MKIETRTALDFFALCERIKNGELQLRSVEMGKFNGWYVFDVSEHHKKNKPILTDLTDDWCSI